MESASLGVKVKFDDDFKVEVNFTIWDVTVNFNDDVNDDGKVDGNRDTTKMKSNTILPPTMAVVSRRILTYLQVKVVEASLVDLDEARGDLLVAS